MDSPELAYKWAKHSHPNKPKHWISSKYFRLALDENSAA